MFIYKSLIPLILLADIVSAQNIIYLSPEDVEATSTDLIGQVSNLTYVDSKIYTTEGRTGQIHVYDNNLEHLFSVGQTGRGPGDLSWPSKIVPFENKIFVEEGRALRLSVFDLEGSFLTNIPLRKRTLSFALTTDFLIGFDRSSENPFHLFDLESKEITTEFGYDSIPDQNLNEYSTIAQNQYLIHSFFEDEHVLAVQQSTGNFFILQINESPKAENITAEIDNKLFINRLSYIEDCFNNVDLQQLSWPLFITDLRVCEKSEMVYIAFLGQDNESLFQNLLLQLSFNGNSIKEEKSYLFGERLFREFTLSDDCQRIFFYDHVENVIVRYGL